MPFGCFKVTGEWEQEVVRFLHRLLRQPFGKPSRVRIRRSMTLASTLYRLFAHRGRSYVAISALTKGKRLILPLRGQGAIHGNIRVVWDRVRGVAAIPMPYDVRLPVSPASGSAIGLDAGVTEVLATSTGQKLGQGYGKILDRLTQETTQTGKARNKLHQPAKKADDAGDIAKAARIRRHHLGGKKLRTRRAQGEAAIKTVVGEAVRRVFYPRPSVVVWRTRPICEGLPAAANSRGWSPAGPDPPFESGWNFAFSGEVPAWKRSTLYTPVKPVLIRRVGMSTKRIGTGIGFPAS